MKRILVALALVSSTMLGACKDVSKTTEVITNNYFETVSVSSDLTSAVIALNTWVTFDVTTTITGRDSATFADTTTAKLDQPDLGHIERLGWSKFSSFDEIANQPMVIVLETYRLYGDKLGSTVFHASSVSNPSARVQAIVQITR